MALECRLKMRNDRPFETRVDVPPMILVLGVSAPFVGKRSPAREADCSIDD